MEPRPNSPDHYRANSEDHGDPALPGADYRPNNARHFSSGSHIAPLLLDTDDAQSGRVKVRSRRRVSSVKAWLQHFQRQRLFFYLLLVALFMVLLNIIQAFLISHMRQTWWIVILPLAVLVTLLLAIVIAAVWHRGELIPVWHEAEVPQRLAWISITLSLLLPVIVCQFFYMPYVAVPHWDQTKWTISDEYRRSTLFPAVFIGTWQGQYHSPVIGKGCWIYGSSNNNVTDCDVSVNAKLPYMNDPRNHTYVLFDPSKQQNTLVSSVATHMQKLHLNISLTYYWNASTTGNSVIESSPIGISVFDASLPFNVTDLLNECGNPSPYYSFWQVISTQTRVFLSAGITAMDNNVDMVPLRDGQPSSEACSAGLAAKSSYDYFTPVLQTFDSGQQCDSSAATKDDRGYLTLKCWLNLYVSLQSTLATTQKSSRGTSTLKILIDEGSIVGGIMFFTWFLTIFL